MKSVCLKSVITNGKPIMAVYFPEGAGRRESVSVDAYYFIGRT